MRDTLWIGNGVADDLLDLAHPPVARFRVFSYGLAANHMLPTQEAIAGSSACVSCGNCLDACPVIAGKTAEEVFGRTSMALEQIVGAECRRCYKCIAACPQIDKPIKDYVHGFRRVERIAHWLAAISAVLLALSGITIFHYRDSLPQDYYYLLGAVHRTFAFALVAALVVYVFLDRRHFHRAWHKTLTWTKDDWTWTMDLLRWARSFGRAGKLMRGDFNTGQKLWYAFLAVALALFAASGGSQWAGPAPGTDSMADSARLVHTNVAVVFDVMLLWHVCLKILLPGARDVIRGISHSITVRRARGKGHGVARWNEEPNQVGAIKIGAG